MKFILASKSPRRREILTNLGLDFEVVTSEAPEVYDPSLSPCDVVKFLAVKKAEAVRDKLLSEGKDLSDTVIIASDTVVAAEGQILGKPRDKEDARRMISLIEGRKHSVLSGISIIKGDKIANDYDETFVRFTHMTDDEINWYVSTGECDDKAGAYAIQGYASLWIDGIEGDYFNVVGLPVPCMRRLLSEKLGTDIAGYLK